MEFNLNEGLNCIMQTKVTENDTAIKYGSGTLKVYATPAMIALIENTAKSCVELHLPPDYTTVGTEVNIKHIKSTPVGMKVKCEAILKEIDGKKLFFEVNVWDEKGKIGVGTHKRYIVNSREFLKKTNDQG